MNENLKIKGSMVKILLLLSFVFMSHCSSYKIGRGPRSIPGGYRKLAVPIFKNKSMEPGIEIYFTNALRNELQNSHVAEIVDKGQSDVFIEGVVTSVSYQPKTILTSDDTSVPHLPKGAALTSVYQILVSATLRVVRGGDGVELWRGQFSGERTYNAPLVTLYGVNSVNPLYNLSARRQNIESMAVDMMSEAHGRITENF